MKAENINSLKIVQDTINKYIALDGKIGRPELNRIGELLDIVVETEQEEPMGDEYRIMIEKASLLLSDGDLSLAEAIEAIAKHPEQDDLIDNVEGIIVWEPLEGRIHCDEFLSMVNYPATKPEPKLTYWLLGEQVSKDYSDGGIELAKIAIATGNDYDLYIHNEQEPAVNLALAIDGWMGFIEITEQEYKELEALREKEATNE